MRLLIALVLIAMLAGLGGAGAGLWVFHQFGRDLPDYQQLADYQPPVVTRMHAGDGRLLAEFAREKRVFVPVAAMPKIVLKAFISAEDQNFYNHYGIDPWGVARAAITNLQQLGSSRRPVGASTITQQVAKNFLLSGVVSIERKIQEAILAFRIERAFSKDQILELYLNEIYLGLGSYGVAAAALNYFDKSLDELTLGEIAYLAGLPKAPNNYHPTRHRAAAHARRDYVLRRMTEDGYITAAEAEDAAGEPIELRPRSAIQIAEADYFVEEVRRELSARFGERALYEGGLSVRTSLDSGLQAMADAALRRGLVAFDRRRGWRGPLDRLNPRQPWQPQLARVPVPGGIEPWQAAVVTDLATDHAAIEFAGGRAGTIPMDGLAWARPVRDGRLGPAPRAPGDALAVGDVVLVERREEGEGYDLRQIPEVGGGVVALDPHTGRVLAMSGGFSYAVSEFNRASQARRQPGSAFKPFVYLAALENGFTPSSIVLDAPIVIDQGPGLGRWRPTNYGDRIYGPTPLRVGIEKSRNLMTVRLAQSVGIEQVAQYAEQFGVVDHLPRVLSMALGAGETTLLRLTAGYAMLVNGGKRIEPTLIDRIQDRAGRTIFRHDRRACEGCRDQVWRDGLLPPVPPDEREQLADPRSVYQVVSMLQGVVERGTGSRLRGIGKPLAGKTGTTNDSRDAWFVGFTPDLAVGVFVGYDDPKPLGPRETGASVAVPIFGDFLRAALADKPGIPFRIPPGLRLVRVHADTGQPVRGGGPGTILEAFKPGSEPTAAPMDARDLPRGPDGTGAAPAGRAEGVRDLY